MKAVEAQTIDYTAIRDGAALLRRSDGRPISVTRADRSSLLQRITTNDIDALAPHRSAITILTDPTARILFVFTVLNREDHLLLLPAPGQSDSLAQHLRGQIFFMDKVELKPAPHNRWRIVGPNAGDVLRSAGWEAPAEDGQYTDSGTVLIIKQTYYDIPGFELLSASEDAQQIERLLHDAGAHFLADDNAYTQRRIELGRPAPGYEIVNSYNPLEVGLAWACSDKKGCYTGQEIIARQTNYDKITKTLVGLASQQSLGIGEQVSVAGKPVGQVTSAAFSPPLGSHIALAVLRRPHNQPGETVDVGGAQATTVALPFE